MRTLRWYVLRQHLVPGLIGFGVVTGMFQVELLVDYLDLWIRRGIPLWAIAQIFLYSLGYMAALSIPCGVLVASLVTFGRMMHALDGQVAVFFVLVVAAAEVVVGLAIIVAIFRRRASADADQINLLKW